MRRDLQARAAWVPDDDGGRTWDEAADLAAEWLLEQAAELGLTPMVVTPTRSQWQSGAEVVCAWASRYGAVTPRTNPLLSPGPKAVLAYVPSYKTLTLGMMYARDGAIAVVETIADPMIGWAMATGAVNLVLGATAGMFDSDTEDLLEGISFAGNNGWTRGHGRTMALRALDRYGYIDPNIVCGYMLAHGHHAESVEDLRKLLDARSP
jgi:hypothetical protein